MIINILTVSDKGDKLKSKLMMMNLDDRHNIEVIRFPLVCSYNNRSDNNSCVKKSILDNTHECVRLGLLYDDYVCVMEDDFIPNKHLNTVLLDCEDFLNNNSNIDMIFITGHPNSRYSVYNEKFNKVKQMMHWTCIIFTRSYYENYVMTNKIQVPYGVHSDVYYNKYYKDDINAYAHKISTGGQKIDRNIRRYEYGFLYDSRYKFRYGDPLLYFCVIIFIIIIIFVLKKYIINFKKYS